MSYVCRESMHRLCDIENALVSIDVLFMLFINCDMNTLFYLYDRIISIVQIRCRLAV